MSKRVRKEWKEKDEQEKTLKKDGEDNDDDKRMKKE